MSEYVIAYRGGVMPESPEDGAIQRAKFNAWLVSLGSAVVNPGTPLGSSQLVSRTGVSPAPSDRLIGFSIITADSMEAALEITRRCPYLDIGTIEVGEVMSM